MSETTEPTVKDSPEPLLSEEQLGRLAASLHGLRGHVVDMIEQLRLASADLEVLAAIAEGDPDRPEQQPVAGWPGGRIVREDRLFPERPYSWQCLIPGCGEAGPPMGTRQTAAAKWVAHQRDRHPELEAVMVRKFSTEDAVSFERYLPPGMEPVTISAESAAAMLLGGRP